MPEFDLSYLTELSQGDKEFEQEMIQIFVMEVPESIAFIKENIQQENWKATGEAVHKLKSKIRIMGINELKDSVTDAELSFKNGENITEAVQSIEQTIPVLEEYVELAQKKLELEYEMSDS